MEANVLYRIRRKNYQGNTGPNEGVIIKGASVSIVVYGSQTLPTLLTDMVDIAAGTTFDAAGAYPFAILPQYICFYGTADSIELINYEIVETLVTFGD